MLVGFLRALFVTLALFARVTRRLQAVNDFN